MTRLVPATAGFLVTEAARLGVTIDNPSEVAALTAGVGVVWYAVFSVLEARGRAIWGVLLGKKPVAKSQDSLPSTN